jgi:hypothetical protein
MMTMTGTDPIKDFVSQTVTGRPFNSNDPIAQNAASIPSNEIAMLDEAVRERHGENS